MSTKAVTKPVLTTGQIARICNVAPRTVSKWFDSGKLKGYRIPGSMDRRVPRHEVLRFLKENGMPLEGMPGLNALAVGLYERDLEALRGALDVPVRAAGTTFEAGSLAEASQPCVVAVDLAIGRLEAGIVARGVKAKVPGALAVLVAPADEETATYTGFDAVVRRPLGPTALGVLAGLVGSTRARN